MATKKPKMPEDCCGNCVFAHSRTGDTYLLCYASLPTLAFDEMEQENVWTRGAAVEANEPRCWYFIPKGRV